MPVRVVQLGSHTKGQPRPSTQHRVSPDPNSEIPSTYPLLITVPDEPSDGTAVRWGSGGSLGPVQPSRGQVDRISEFGSGLTRYWVNG